ncbi:formylglycine-generating enzyme family protein [Rhodobacteraceae bacterium B1Z28]|uniref:Formylglycine-generating enzyme family protein n=1 Tax=Ruegeria haliotis TaxID=2747601 RepID=A0ABX2PS65_9RHOB|nr:formylglycine-generating enzyme family protein [Ruegeria haliotis]NVO56241.1 formylglycine-generating enzyme family protein [Ruegeria haliotis]
MKLKIAALTGALQVVALPVAAEYLLTDGTEVAPLEMFQECGVCPEMIALPLGQFLMGGSPGESRRNFHFDGSGNMRLATSEDPYIAHHEGPVHSVTVDIPFAMGRNEVTHDQWMACVNDDGCNGHIPQDYVLVPREPRAKATGSFPVIDVSYIDALTYTEWLNEKVGAQVYRLPTEAEWEYAARAGTQTPFAQGEEITTDQANFLGSSTEEMLGEERPELLSRDKPVRVNELDAANNWGLRHMSGNVAERTLSCRTESHAGWATTSVYHEMARLPECKNRVTRGGAYWAAMDFSRVAARGSARPSTRTTKAGFRILRELK